MSTGALTGHNHTRFTVSERERSVAFYTEAISFSVDSVYDLYGDAIEQYSGHAQRSTQDSPLNPG